MTESKFHITKELYQTSGHWDKFKTSSLELQLEGHEYCNEANELSSSQSDLQPQKWSYRDLLQRYANTTMCYRDEQSGELALD
ncbi:MAG: hypothetical protein R3B41_01785 [Candidatus Doudnabacteria bacterium]